MSNPGDAHGYVYQNVGVGLVNPGDAHGYATQNVGVDLVNPGDTHGYVYQNVTTGVGVALYPWREDPARPPAARR